MDRNILLRQWQVDFRLLIKDFAKEFSTRVEMKQVGFRQKQRFGGIGSVWRIVLFYLVNWL
jgi:cell fate regulator YaaT (PSP1 superfamily)